MCKDIIPFPIMYCNVFLLFFIVLKQILIIFCVLLNKILFLRTKKPRFRGCDIFFYSTRPIHAVKLAFAYSSYMRSPCISLLFRLSETERMADRQRKDDRLRLALKTRLVHDGFHDRVPALRRCDQQMDLLFGGDRKAEELFGILAPVPFALITVPPPAPALRAVP